MTATVTIGMPVRNGAEYLEEAIRSLLAQTETDFLLHISDNCSDDATPEICAQLAADDPRILYERQETNLSMAENFTHLLRAARSPFFMWAAHDDLWAPDFLEETLGLLARNPTAIASMSAVRFVDPSGNHLFNVRLPVQMADGDPVTRARSVRPDGCHAIYALFRRSRLESTGIRPEDVPAPDDVFVYGLALHGGFVASDRTLSTRRLIGYSDVLGPDGRVAWEKALGPDGGLYAWAPTASCRAMLRHTRSAPVTSWGRVQLCGHILRIWLSRTEENLAVQTGRMRIVHAWGQRRYLTACLLVCAHAVLRPRSLLREARRVLGAYRGKVRWPWPSPREPGPPGGGSPMG